MGIITIAFDDGYKDTFKHCAELLTENGIPATFAIPSSYIGKTLENRDVISEEDVKYLVDNGHEIAAHSLTHRNMLDAFNSEGEKAVKSEMKRSKDILEEKFGGRIESFVFPFIKNNQTPYLRTLASEYYTSSRISTESFAFNELPVKDPYSITGTCITTDIPMAEYEKLIEIVSKKDLWLIEVFHLVSDKNTKSAHRDAPYRFFTHVDEFKKHIGCIKSMDIQVLTQKEAITRQSL